MRKIDLCICTKQRRRSAVSNCKADKCLLFRHKDSTIPNPFLQDSMAHIIAGHASIKFEKTHLLWDDSFSLKPAVVALLEGLYLVYREHRPLNKQI